MSSWSTFDLDCFIDALKHHGCQFERISNTMAEVAADTSFKSADQCEALWMRVNALTRRTESYSMHDDVLGPSEVLRMFPKRKAGELGTFSIYNVVYLLDFLYIL